MTGFIIRRVGQAIIVTLLVSIITYSLMHAMPGGIRAILGSPRATPAQLHAFAVEYGYNRPLYVQFWKWLTQVLQGNLGYSSKLNQSVSSLIAQRLPKTFALLLIATVLSLIIGVPVGVYQAVRRYTVGDYVLTGIGFIGYSAPVFFVGTVMISWFADDLHLLPSEAPQGDTLAQVLAPSQWSALVLPVFTLGFLGYALWSRYMRSSVMDNIVQDYVRTARAKGASERRVIWGHIFRNSLISIVTLLGLSIPGLVGGAVITEEVFNYPGMGLAFYQAALDVDYPVMLAIVLIGTVATIIGNLLADIGYAVLDPRVRYS